MFLFAFLPTVLFSQIYVDDYDINADENIQFCQVSIDCRINNKVFVRFDYGQRLKRIFSRTTIFDKNNKRVNFNSVAGVLNFMLANGWEVMGDNPIQHNVKGYNAVCLFRKVKQEEVVR